MMNICHNHNALLRAIEQNEEEHVHQLLDSGIPLNTVLHSPSRREHATVLGTASFAGRIQIIHHLLKLKVNVNYQDPSLSRNALHWAAIGGRYKATKLLIEHGTEIDCRDRNNVTPLIYATIKGHTLVAKLLIERGANVNLYDRLHSSALHYATFHGKSDIATLVIKAGCVQNNPAIFGQGTPLANLFYRGDTKNCKLLLDAGYTLEKDIWILQCDFSGQMSGDENIGELLLSRFRNPQTLGKICRLVIRASMNGEFVQQKIKSLSLPQRIIDYLMLEN